jgi:hypothetical protein
VVVVAEAAGVEANENRNDKIRATAVIVAFL